VRKNFAGPPGAEFAQQLVKANSAMTVSIFVGAITERDHPVGHASQVRLLSLKTSKQPLRIVGDIALSVGGSANQECAATPKDASVKTVHHLNRCLMASRLQHLLDLLRHHLGRAGHGSDQDRDVKPHACVPHPVLLYVRLWKYNASTVSRKRDIVHVEEKDSEGDSSAVDSISADASGSEYLRLLGVRVRETRARRGMTRKILARDSGVSERYLAQLETGQGNVSILLLRQIAQALDTPLQALVLEGPEPPVDLVHTTEFLRRLPATELVEARRLLVEHFGGVDLDARRGRIALIGLRGAGKSTLGAMLADRSEAPFLELDRLIEQESGVSLSVIFDLYGQSGFRRLERRVLDQVIERYPRFVLATGGSLVSEPATFERLLTMCFTVWLRATPEEHMQRVIAQGDMRPMADNRESMSDLRRILDVREPLYRKADAIISTSSCSAEQSVAMLEQAIGQG
jgi:XRE family transcriptional regulator, aerobic/anaerobic benzoate catabolism transcriptional regulator